MAESKIEYTWRQPQPAARLVRLGEKYTVEADYRNLTGRALKVGDVTLYESEHRVKVAPSPQNPVRKAITAEVADGESGRVSAGPLEKKWDWLGGSLTALRLDWRRRYVYSLGGPPGVVAVFTDGDGELMVEVAVDRFSWQMGATAKWITGAGLGLAVSAGLHAAGVGTGILPPPLMSGTPAATAVASGTLLARREARQAVAKDESRPEQWWNTPGDGPGAWVHHSPGELLDRAFAAVAGDLVLSEQERAFMSEAVAATIHEIERTFNSEWTMLLVERVRQWRVRGIPPQMLEFWSEHGLPVEALQQCVADREAASVIYDAKGEFASLVPRRTLVEGLARTEFGRPDRNVYMSDVEDSGWGLPFGLHDVFRSEDKRI